jgi:MFS family permease
LDTPDTHDAYAALRHRDYRLLLTGAVLTSVGMEVQACAVGWELYQRTGSELLLGEVGLVQFLPVLLFALPAGQTADHFSRKLVFQLAQMTAALSSVSLAVLSWCEGPVNLVLLTLFVSGTARAFSAPARQSLLPQIVPLRDLPNAVAWNSTGWQIANVAGPGLGGLVLLVAPPVAAYCLAAAGASACVVLLAPVRPLARPGPPLARSLTTLLAGVRFVFRTELLLAAITLDLFAVLLGGATALLPVFARDILKVGPIGYGALRAAPAVGALVMALALAHRPPLRRPGLALLLAVAGFGVATVVFGISESFPLSFAMLTLAGALDNVSVVVRGTLMQILTPDEMRGRVAAVNVVFISSSNELGAFESGVTAAWWGPVASVVAGGVGTVAVVLSVWVLWPRLAHIGPLHTLSPQLPEGERSS